MNLSELVIDRLALGGSGVGRLNGKVCFVPFSAPGDHLKVRVIREHRSYCEAELVEVCRGSALRSEPQCPVFGQCGGCDWQHISYAGQCSAKQQILTDTLQRIARFEAPPVTATAASDEQYGYRSRAQFKLFSTSTSLRVGFYRRGSHQVIDLPQGCPVVTSNINSTMLSLRGVLQCFSARDCISQISLEEGLAGVAAIVHFRGTAPDQLSRHLLQHQEALGLAGCYVQNGSQDALMPVFGSGHLAYQVPQCNSVAAITLGYGIGGFSQVNRQQNRTMIELVCRYARPDARQRLLDLYCGNGNLSLPLTGCVQDLLGIEGFAPSIASAVDNARQLRVNNSTFRCNNVATEVRQLVQRHEQFDLVLLDPPRAGAAETVKALSTLGAERIVYVSCDPGTLSRDLSVLCSSGGFRLIEVTPLDMFPQTAHLESVALLIRT